MWMAFPTLFQFPARQVPDAFKPSCHIFYEQRCVDIRDDKTKWSKHQDESEIIPDG